jgi:hypothetical protein
MTSMNKSSTITDPNKIQKVFNDIHQAFPGIVRIPFQTNKHNFVCAFSILGSYDNNIVLYLTDTSDRQRLETAKINWNINNKTWIYSTLYEKIFSIKYIKGELNRVRDAAAISEIIYKTKVNYSDGDGYIKPSLFFTKDSVFSREFVELIIIPIPKKVYEFEQERQSPRVPIPPDIPVPVTIHNPGRSKQYFLNSSVVKPKQKADLSRTWETMAKMNNSMLKIFTEFFSIQKTCIFSPYFPIKELVPEKFHALMVKADRIKTDYPSFESIKKHVLTVKQELFSEPRLIVPLKIFGKIEGHVLFIKCNKDNRIYNRMLVYILEHYLEKNAYFAIDIKNAGTLIDISTQGLKVTTNHPTHGRLEKGIPLICEFPLLWSINKPIKIGAKVVAIKENCNSKNQSEFDIHCEYSQNDEISNQMIYYINKYVKDHEQIAFS